jgi:hypothetical protein
MEGASRFTLIANPNLDFWSIVPFTTNRTFGGRLRDRRIVVSHISLCEEFHISIKTVLRQGSKPHRMSKA